MDWYESERAWVRHQRETGQDLPTGWPIGKCCRLAQPAQCVCDHSWYCPQHGSTCVGSHE